MGKKKREKRLTRIEAKCDRLLAEVLMMRHYLRAERASRKMLDTARLMLRIKNGEE